VADLLKDLSWSIPTTVSILLFDKKDSCRNEKGADEMNLFSNFVMKRETMVFIPKYDAQGNLCTDVLGTAETVKVTMNPTKLIDENLRYFGSSFQGACQGARAILGNITMYPIVVNEKLDLYWFPSRSPAHPNCVWFALHHVDKYEAFGKNRTKVTLSNGSNFFLDVGLSSFERKIQRAYTLKYKVEERTKLNSIFVNESIVQYNITKKGNDRNYIFIEQKNE